MINTLKIINQFTKNKLNITNHQLWNWQSWNQQSCLQINQNWKRIIFQKTFHDEFIDNFFSITSDSQQFQDNFTVKNLYYKKFCHDLSDFSDNFLQENFYFLKIDYNFADNESFFNNNAECYNCNAEFSSNNQFYNHLIACKSFILWISNKYLVIFTQDFETQTN